jgi:hypothetical protein
MLAPLTVFLVHAAVAVPMNASSSAVAPTPASTVVMLDEPIRQSGAPRQSRFQGRHSASRLSRNPVLSPVRIPRSRSAMRAAIFFAGAFAGFYAGSAISAASSPDCPPSLPIALGGAVAGGLIASHFVK